jgi:hypothetical protein
MSAKAHPHEKKSRTGGWALLAFGALWLWGVLHLTPQTNPPGPPPVLALVVGLFCLYLGLAFVAANRDARWWATAGLIVFFAFYLEGYILLGRIWTVREMVFRDFHQRWVANAYWPLGWCECEIRQKAIMHRWPLKGNKDGARGRIFNP